MGISIKRSNSRRKSLKKTDNLMQRRNSIKELRHHRDSEAGDTMLNDQCIQDVASSLRKIGDELYNSRLNLATKTWRAGLAGYESTGRANLVQHGRKRKCVKEDLQVREAVKCKEPGLSSIIIDGIELDSSRLTACWIYRTIVSSYSLFVHILVVGKTAKLSHEM